VLIGRGYCEFPSPLHELEILSFSLYPDYGTYKWTNTHSTQALTNEAGIFKNELAFLTAADPPVRACEKRQGRASMGVPVAGDDTNPVRSCFVFLGARCHNRPGPHSAQSESSRVVGPMQSTLQDSKGSVVVVGNGNRVEQEMSHTSSQFSRNFFSFLKQRRLGTFNVSRDR